MLLCTSKLSTIPYICIEPPAKYWALTSFLKRGHALREVNKTYLILIPKMIIQLVFFIIGLLAYVIYLTKSFKPSS